jgi:hypothetical protein
MAINITSAPAPSIDALRTALPSLINRPALKNLAPHLAATLTTPAAAASLTPVLSYRVYTLGLSDLAAAASNGLRAAKTSIWRHTLASKGEVVTVDIAVDQTGANHKFASLSSNPSAAAVQSTIHTLSQDAELAKASYEVSLLQIPALGVRAVWLHDVSGKAADILVPVAPVRPELVAGRRYQLAEFTAALKDAAAKILANDDPRKGSA